MTQADSWRVEQRHRLRREQRHGILALLGLGIVLAVVLFVVTDKPCATVTTPVEAVGFTAPAKITTSNGVYVRTVYGPDAIVYQRAVFGGGAR